MRRGGGYQGGVGLMLFRGGGVIMHSALELYIRSSNLKGHVVNVFDCVWHEAFPFSQF